MSRPTKTEALDRRQRARLYLVATVRENATALRLMSEQLGVSERTLKSDLDAIQREFESEGRSFVPEGLTEAIEAADTFRLLKRLGKTVMREMAEGTIERELGSALIDAIREQRQVLAKARDEETEAAVMAIEILTPQERAVLDKYRASLVPPALKPGEFPAPPEGVELPKAPPYASPSNEKTASDASDTSVTNKVSDVSDGEHRDVEDRPLTLEDTDEPVPFGPRHSPPPRPPERSPWARTMFGGFFASPADDSRGEP